jgi:hypothetical protein
MPEQNKIDVLRDLDGLRRVPFHKCECFLHEDHRWVLPIIQHAQENGTLPAPCTLIVFDAHHDTKDPIPDCMKEIQRIRESELSFESIIRLCQEHLDPNDGDWIKAGMELGLIRDAVIFGLQHFFDSRIPRKFSDHQGDEHRIELLSLPLEELKRQGRLSDSCRKNNLSELWSILDWGFIPQKGFFFKENAKDIILDFDLDCFVMTWKDYTFPWPDEVFEKEFLHKSKYWSTEGWSGKKFLDGLVNRAKLLTIAREPKFCGGDKKANVTISKVNNFLFDNKLSLK